MIGALTGKLARKDTDGVLIDVGGVGYLVSVPLSSFYELPELGQEVSLRIHTYVRDDSIDLYGFGSGSEQALFEELIGVAGVGPKLAVTILSGMESELLVASIADEDVARLTTIPGVGKKTAERLVLELKDKVADMAPAASPTSVRGVREDVVSALMNLGYRQRDAERALEKVEEPAEEFEELLRQTLRNLAR